MKFRIQDEDGTSYYVEEMKDEDVVSTEEEVVAPAEETTEAPLTLTNEEILQLRELLPYAEKLKQLVAEDDAEEAVEEEVETEEDEFIEDEDTTEELIETEEEKVLKKDSKMSFGATERRKSSKVDDSLVEDEIARAWANRCKARGGDC